MRSLRPTWSVATMAVLVACGSGATERPSPTAVPPIADPTPTEPMPRSSPEPAMSAEPAVPEGAEQAPQAGAPGSSEDEASPPIATLANAGGERCVLGDEIEIGRARSRAVDVAVAFASADRGLIVWSIDASHVRARSIGAGAELGGAIESELGHAHGIDVLAPVGDRYLAITRADMCDEQGSACMHARAFAADGSPAGAQLDEVFTEHEEIELRGWVPMPEGGAISMATRWGGPRLTRFRVLADGALRAETLVECCAGFGPGSGPYPTIARDGEGVLVIGMYEQALGDSAPPFTLVRWPDTTPRPLRSIPEDARVIAAAIGGDEVHVIFQPPQGRVSLLRTDGRGRPLARPRPIRRADPLPPAFGDRVFPRLGVERGRLFFHRIDSAEREIGEPVEVARSIGSRNAITAAFAGRDFVIVYGAPDGAEWTLHARRALCAP